MKSWNSFFSWSVIFKGACRHCFMKASLRIRDRRLDCYEKCECMSAWEQGQCALARNKANMPGVSIALDLVLFSPQQKVLYVCMSVRYDNYCLDLLYCSRYVSAAKRTEQCRNQNVFSFINFINGVSEGGWCWNKDRFHTHTISFNKNTHRDVIELH